jgi:hypothetical protein
VEYFDRGFVSALARPGVVPNKTLTIPFSTDLPQELQAAFVRGSFDGDGSISIYWRGRRGWADAQRTFLSGSRSMIDGLPFALAHAGISTGRIRSGGDRAIVLPVLTARMNLGRFGECLYAGAATWLARKRTVFRELGLQG